MCVAEEMPRDRTKLLQDLQQSVSQDELRATVDTLVKFGTRHTLSDTKSHTRGIGAARRWAQTRFQTYAQACAGCLEIITPSQKVTGPRIPNETEIVDVVAIQRGAEDPGRVIIVSGHIDSRVSDAMDAKSDAPGANDDGSGTAVVLEAARVLSQYKFPATLVFAVLSGEEQGLYGGKILADYAKTHSWSVEAVLNNDIVGNSRGQNGVLDNTLVRVFSEGTKATETPKQAEKRRYNGGELDSPARNLSRYLDALAQERLTNFKVRQVYRTDRYGRGGDQVPLLELGFPAVRLTEAQENYLQQHQNPRTENGVRYGDTPDHVDFDYLAQVTCLNVLALASLARAPAPPSGVAISGAVTADTTVKWNGTPRAAGYRVWWRETTSPQWQQSRAIGPQDTSVTLRNIVIDDWFFGVSALSSDGFESPIVFPGEAGSFTSEAPNE
jgi:hypothetical protein